MIRASIRLASALWLIHAALGATPLRALVILPVDLGDLVLGASIIVQGRVTGVQAQVADDRRHIDTLVSLEVSDYFKGDLGPRIVFRVPGGEIGRYRNVIVGAPTFAAGDEVVLFLGARGPSIPYVLGLSQGVFRVVRDEQSGERRVLPSPLLASGPDPERVTRGDPARRAVPLPQFAAQVRGLAGTRR